MVPFSRHAQRLSRIVRQAAREAHKEAELHVHGGTSELDRQVMDRALPAIEHLLRNAVIHGIETPDLRRAREKRPTGRIDIRLHREGAEMTIEGIRQPELLRDYLYSRMRGARDGAEAGEDEAEVAGTTEDEALALLREIRDELRRMHAGGSGT